MTSPRAIAAVLASAALFGASTPLARALVGAVSPVWLAALLYAGSGVGLTLLWAARRARGVRGAGIAREDAGWLAAAVLFGGVAAPLLFTHGLARTAGAAASVLLNLEAVFTVVLAWFAFGEHRSARVVAGMALIVAGCTALAWPSSDARLHVEFAGAASIAAACFCWSIDNNVTRRISANDAVAIAAVKGLVGGAVNVSVAVASGAAPPPMLATLAAAAVGFVGYGVSLALFVVALRDLGAGRTSAYYGTAPFFGVAVAFALLAEPVGARFWVALPLAALGVWLHVSERHAHRHAHDAQKHAHAHRHDAHHRHDHDFAWDGREPHVHAHTHQPIVHSHGHTPDLHHGHRH